MVKMIAELPFQIFRVNIETEYYSAMDWRVVGRHTLADVMAML